MNHLIFFSFVFVFAFLNTSASFAGPNRTTYQAKIVKPDGYPLEASSVNFKFTILDPAGSCILYSETYSSVNMSGTGGLISFALGSGVKTYPASATTFEQVFSNITPSLVCDAGGPANYTPGASDARKIVMQFHDGTGWQTLPAMAINAVPYAMYANSAQNLNGKVDTDFVQVAALSTCGAGEALNYNGVGFSCVTIPTPQTVSAAAVVSALGYTPADGASVTALSSSLSSTNADVSSVSSTVSSVSSTVASVSSTVFSVSSTVSSLSNTVSNLSTSVSNLSASMAAITSSQWLTSGTSISYSSGNVGIGTTTPAARLDVSGGVRISMEAASCAAGLAGTLRYNSGAVEYCNGSSWLPFGVAGAGITNINGSTSGSQTFATGVTGTVFNISTVNGVHTFNIPLAATGSVTAGLLSNTDYLTFTNKLNATSAAVISALGYTPADNAASGTYVVKANNLSDLASATVARANLGLGSLATLNFLDLGSAQASGTLAEARLPAFSGDATSPLGSAVLTLASVGAGVTSGTQYTKVTVDGKGRVVSGAQLSSSDVTVALGYTPAQASSSTQWTTSGSTIFYNTGNVGIGTSALTERLTVAGNINLTNPGAAINRYISLATNGGGEKAYIRFDQTAAPGPSNYWDVGSLSGNNSYDFGFESSGTRRMTLTFGGNLGVGVSAPTAKLQLASGTSSLAPLKLTSGTLLSAAQAGAVEYDGSNYYVTDSTNTRRAIATVANPGTLDNTSIISSSGNITMVPVGSVVVSSTTPSTNSSTGALIVKGGMGVAGDIYASGSIVTSANIQGLEITATSATITPYLYGSVVSGGSLYIDSTTHANKGSVILTPNGGNVGVGTSPNGAYRLDVNGDMLIGNGGSAQKLQFRTANTDGGFIRFNSTADSAGNSSLEIGTIDNSDEPIIFTQTANERMRIHTNGYVGIGTTSPSYKLQVHSAGTSDLMLSTGADDSRLYLTDANRSLRGVPGGAIAVQTGATERMRIDSSGNVGIGTTSPSAKLEISGANEGIMLRNTSDGNGAQMFRSVTGGVAITSDQGNSLFISRPTGNVGIGTSSPNASLDVSGSMIVTGGIFGANTGAPDATIFGVSKTTYPNWGIFYNEGAPDYIEYKSAGVVTSRIELDSGSAHFGLNGGNVGIGTTNPTRTLEVSGSIAAAGMAAEYLTLSVDGVANNTYAIGSLTNNSRSTHVKFNMYVHNNSTIDALVFEVSLPSYTNGTFYTGWQELPVAFGSSAWNGLKNYVVDVLRSANTSGSTMYFRVRNKNGNGSANTMNLRMEYNSDATFTRITHANTVGTAFNAGTAAAGGAVDGMYGALEYSFPVAIGQAWRPADNSGLFIKNSGYVGIGTSSPSVELEVSGTVKAIAYLYTSDRRLKKDIVTLPDALTKALQLRGVNFVWRNTEEKTVGFIAQEVEQVYPELVKTDSRTGFKAVQYGNIVAILVEALKQENKERVEAQNRCEAQVSQVQRAVASVDEKSSARMHQLEKENKDLKARLEKLEKFISEKVK